MSDVYTKHVSWLFSLNDETWELERLSNGACVVSETRCNGQEDTHVQLVIDLEDGAWSIVEGEGQLNDYRDPSYVAAFEAFFAEHGVPDE